MTCMVLVVVITHEQNDSTMVVLQTHTYVQLKISSQKYVKVVFLSTFADSANRSWAVHRK